MDELIKLVTAKTGLSAGQAKQAIEVVLGFLKEKLPAPIAGQIDGLLAGGGEGLGGLTKGLGGILGKK